MSACSRTGRNAATPAKLLSLSVSDASTPPAGTTPPAGGTSPSTTPPASDPAPQEGEPVSDGANNNGSSDPLPDFTPTKKKDAAASDGGCSMSSAPAPLSSSLPIVGVLLGLVALVRRRRQA